MTERPFLLLNPFPPLLLRRSLMEPVPLQQCCYRDRLTRASPQLSPPCRVREVLNEASPDKSMMQALPPGAWWDQNLNSWDYDSQFSGDEELASEAAAAGSLELRDVTFSYPARREAGSGEDPSTVASHAGLLSQPSCS